MEDEYETFSENKQQPQQTITKNVLIDSRNGDVPIKLFGF